MVVHSLIDKLSAKNRDDMHMTLNASAVLTEFCENESFFALLTEPETLKKIVGVCSSTDANKMNQPYALNFFTQIMTQFIEQDVSFFKERKEALVDRLLVHFVDICYNCMLLLRGGDSETYANQSGRQVRKTGMLRIRAIEQLRTIFTVLSKRGPMQMRAALNDTLRKKMIETMLYMMRTFQFCSISHQQGLLVLNLIREVFDEDDLETMKSFVKEELEGDTDFHYPSGKTTSRMNLGQITKIAFELKHITQKALDEQDSSDEDEGAMDQESIEKRSKLQSWFHFCEEKVTVIEKTWNKKLEHAGQEPVATNSKLDKGLFDNDDEQDHEQTIENMLMNFNPNRLMRANSAEQTGDQSGIGKLVKSISNTDEDAFKEKTTGEYGDNQFWKAPDSEFDLDELMADL